MKIILELDDIKDSVKRFKNLGGLDSKESLIITKGEPDTESIIWLKKEGFCFRKHEKYSVFYANSSGISNKIIEDNVKFIAAIDQISIAIIGDLIHPLLNIE